MFANPSGIYLVEKSTCKKQVLRLLTKFILKGMGFVFLIVFYTKGKKNGIIEAEKGDEYV